MVRGNHRQKKHNSLKLFMGSSVSPLTEMDESGSISPCEVATCLRCGIEFSGEIHPAALIKSLFEYKDKKQWLPFPLHARLQGQRRIGFHFLD
ncbi:hypothetical protein NC651_030857 [Populus alba x Populus x berolinensis]|nr:hypothetical protein NC651_030857 [Populus alba x Populus x berolinensis]